MLKYRLMDPAMVKAAKEVPIVIHGHRFDEDGECDMSHAEYADEVVAIEELVRKASDPDLSGQHQVERVPGSSVPTAVRPTEEELAQAAQAKVAQQSDGVQTGDQSEHAQE